MKFYVEWFLLFVTFPRLPTMLLGSLVTVVQGFGSLSLSMLKAVMRQSFNPSGFIIFSCLQ